jgi:hypothetical protein
LGVLRRRIRDREDPVEKLLADAVLDRRPPKLLAEVEFVAAANDPSTARDFRRQKRMVADQVEGWSERYGIDRRLFHVWAPPSMTLTKIGSHVPVASVMGSGGAGSSQIDTADKYEQSIRIHNNDDKSSSPIVDKRSSLLHVLAGYALYSLRIYVILPDDFSGDLEEMRRNVKADLPDVEWK